MLRNGKWVILDAKLLVPGDIVELTVGDKVPADIRLSELCSISFQIEEAALTGEAVQVDKQTEKIVGGGDMLQDMRNMVFSSTIVTYGTARGIVVHTGMKTAIGTI